MCWPTAKHPDTPICIVMVSPILFFDVSWQVAAAMHHRVSPQHAELLWLTLISIVSLLHISMPLMCRTTGSWKQDKDTCPDLQESVEIRWAPLKQPLYAHPPTSIWCNMDSTGTTRITKSRSEIGRKRFSESISTIYGCHFLAMDELLLLAEDTMYNSSVEQSIASSRGKPSEMMHG